MITGLYPSQHGVDERAPPTQDAKRAHVALKATDHGILGKLRREGYHIYILTANPHLTPHFGFTLQDDLHFLRRREATTKTLHAHTKQLEPPKSRHSPHKARRSQNPHRSRRQIHHHKHRQTHPPDTQTSPTLRQRRRRDNEKAGRNRAEKALPPHNKPHGSPRPLHTPRRPGRTQLPSPPHLQRRHLHRTSPT
jgi:hypothetical protein